jgi:hypothetical protein
VVLIRKSFLFVGYDFRISLLNLLCWLVIRVLNFLNFDHRITWKIMRSKFLFSLFRL